MLTIDLVRQAILEEELAKGVQAAGAAWGTAVALDPRTGAILAMANVPTYDPNRAGQFSDAARRNHAVVDRIEPGSTFKLVTAIAALESGAVDLQDVYDTGQGWRVFGGHTVRDAHGYGPLTFAQGIAKSSNIVMALAAQDIGAGPMYQAARDLGFGQPTYVDLPGEVAGSLRQPEDWGRSTLTSISRGYAVEVTPLQIAVAYAALANGGLLVRPYVVAERREAATGRVVWQAQPDSIRRAFRATTAQSLMRSFEDVVGEGGTAPRAAVPGLRVAGKTGTAQTASGGGYNESYYRSSFVGMFPVEDPEVVIAIVLDRPRIGYSGGTVAAPIFGQVASRWIGTFPTVAERVAPSGTIAKRTGAPVPVVRGMPAILAAHRVEAEGLSPRWDDRAPWSLVTSREARRRLCPPGPHASASTSRPTRATRQCQTSGARASARPSHGCAPWASRPRHGPRRDPPPVGPRRSLAPCRGRPRGRTMSVLHKTLPEIRVAPLEVAAIADALEAAGLLGGRRRRSDRRADLGRHDRQPASRSGVLFGAISPDTHAGRDGHDFVDDALGRGASAALVSGSVAEHVGTGALGEG